MSFFRARMLAGVFYRAFFHFGNSRRNTYHAGVTVVKKRLPVSIILIMPRIIISAACEIGDNAIFQRTDRFDILVRLLIHLHCRVTD